MRHLQFERDQDQSELGSAVIIWQTATPVPTDRRLGYDVETMLTGRCICGAVGITGTANEPRVAASHCDMCRSWSSGPYFEVSCENVVFECEDNITKIRSSDWVECGFCNKYGSNLFYHIIDSNEFQIAAGLLDDQSDLHLALQVFTDKKPPYYTLADKTETMTAAEAYAAYAPVPD